MSLAIGTKVKIKRPQFTSPGWNTEFWDEVDKLEGVVIESPEYFPGYESQYRSGYEILPHDESWVKLEKHPTKDSIILTFFEDELEVIE